ncbi:MAG: FtsX-like permease family protein [Thermoanaerobaculia bacterium]
MAFESRIARRYLWTARKQAHTAFLSLISMLGLAVGVATLLISIALLTGLQTQIKSRLMSSSPQVLVEPAGKNTIRAADEVMAEARRLGMTDIRPHVSGIAWGANELEERGRPLRLTSFGSRLPEGEDASTVRDFTPASDIVLTRGAAAGLSLDLGDEITVVAPRSRLTPFGPVPVWKKYRIARLIAAPLEEEASDAWLVQTEAANLFGTGGEPTGIQMYGPAERADAVQAALAARFPQAQFKTWKEVNRPLFLALRLEKIVMFATISLIILVAALNLVSSLSMLILEKRPAVGVLRTLGATDRSILRLFLEVGLLIGLTGTVLGNVFGLGLSWAADRFHLVPLPSDVYFVSYLPFRLDLGDIVGVNVIAVCLSVLATWYPAWIASKLDPIAAIREE